MFMVGWAVGVLGMKTLMSATCTSLNGMQALVHVVC